MKSHVKTRVKRKPKPSKKSGVKPKPSAKPQLQSTTLKGWHQIAGFLGQPLSVAQRWAKTGMPVARQGRSVVASSKALNEWLGGESGGEPVHVATPETDLSAELKRGLSFVRHGKNPETKREQSATSRKRKRR